MLFRSQNVTLCADLRDLGSNGSTRVAGESEITHQGTLSRIARVYLDPENVPAYPGAVRAILDADLIIAGPGSLYTSVLPNLLVQDIQRALHASPALKVYVCNVATQPGETNDFSVEDHWDALAQHVGAEIFTRVIANDNWKFSYTEYTKSKMVRLRENGAREFQLTRADLLDESKPWRHDPAKLARVILDLYDTQRR